MPIDTNDTQMTLEEVSEKLRQRDEELEKVIKELQIAKSDAVILKDIIVRLSAKLVGVLQ